MSTIRDAIRQIVEQRWWTESTFLRFERAGGKKDTYFYVRRIHTSAWYHSISFMSVFKFKYETNYSSIWRKLIEWFTSWYKKIFRLLYSLQSYLLHSFKEKVVLWQTHHCIPIISFPASNCIHAKVEVNIIRILCLFNFPSDENELKQNNQKVIRRKFQCTRSSSLLLS